MARLLTIGGACLALGLAAAGCGGGNSGSSSSGSGGTSSAAKTTPASSASKGSSGMVVTVQMQGFAFSPSTVRAKVGQTVKWVNDDPAPHNATAQNGGDLATPTVDQGGSVTFKPTKAETIQYTCTVHPNMHGTLVVTK